MTKEVPLTQDKVALVDDEDYDRVCAHRWCFHNIRGYHRAVSRINGELVSMADFILGVISGQEVDHINHDTLDNRRENIRPCTRSQNLMNARKRTGQCSSRFKGIWWDKSVERWHAEITVRGNTTRVGTSECEIEAAGMYNYAAKKLFGEFAYVNDVDDLEPALVKERRQAGCTSQHRGVTFVTTTGRWRARIMRSGKYVHLGYFGTEIEAANAIIQHQGGSTIQHK